MLANKILRHYLPWNDWFYYRELDIRVCNTHLVRAASFHARDPAWTLISLLLLSFTSILLSPLHPSPSISVSPSAVIWMLVSPPVFICWNLACKMTVLGGRAFEKWLDHKGRVLMNGISALIKEAPESFLAPSHTWSYSKKIALSKGGLHQTQICQYHDPGLPAFRTVRNNVYCLQATQFMALCYSSQKGLRHLLTLSPNLHVISSFPWPPLIFSTFQPSIRWHLGFESSHFPWIYVIQSKLQES